MGMGNVKFSQLWGRFYTHIRAILDSVVWERKNLYTLITFTYIYIYISNEDYYGLYIIKKINDLYTGRLYKKLGSICWLLF